MRARQALARGVAAIALVLAPQVASAQEAIGFGKRSSFALSLENMFGYGSTTVSTGGDRTLSFDNRGILAPFLFRLGLTGISSSGITFTGLVGVDYYKEKDASDANIILGVGGRLGYAFPISPLFAFWLRGGAGYLHVAQGGSKDSAYAVTAGVDALMVVTPVPHFGAFVGLTVDFPITGSSEGDHGEKTAFAFQGLTAGILWDF